MKKLFIYFFIGLLQFSFITCQSKDTKITNNIQEEVTSAVRVYYFHFTRRCTTCKAVEEVTQEILNKYYADQIKSKIIIFKSINLDEPAGQSIASELKVPGQTLLFISENDTVNMTNQAFMYAVSNPQHLSTLMTDAIDKML